MGEPDDLDDCAAWDRACEAAHRRMEEDAIEAHRRLSPESPLFRPERLSTPVLSGLDEHQKPAPETMTGAFAGENKCKNLNLKMLCELRVGALTTAVVTKASLPLENRACGLPVAFLRLLRGAYCACPRVT